MEESGFQEIIKALELHSAHIDKKMDQMKTDLEKQMDQMKTNLEKKMDDGFKRVDKRFEQVDKRFENLEKKVDGIRVDLTENQDTTDLLSTKVLQHEKKLRNLTLQQ